MSERIDLSLNLYFFSDAMLRQLADAPGSPPAFAAWQRDTFSRELKLRSEGHPALEAGPVWLPTFTRAELESIKDWLGTTIEALREQAVEAVKAAMAMGTDIRVASEPSVAAEAYLELQFRIAKFLASN